MANLRFLTAKKLKINAATILLFLAAQPAFSETTKIDPLSEIKNAVNSRVDELNQVVKFLGSSESSIEEKLDRISQILFTDGRGFELDFQSLAEGSTSEDFRILAESAIANKFFKHVDTVELPFYNLLSEKLNSSLDIFGESGRYQKRISDAFEWSCRNFPALNWFVLSEVAKQMAIYRVLDYRLQSVESNISILNDMEKMAKKVNLSVEPLEEQRRFGIDQLCANMDLRLFESEKSFLSFLKKELETQFSAAGVVKEMTPKDLEKLCFPAEDFRFDNFNKGIAVMICCPGTEGLKGRSNKHLSMKKKDVDPSTTKVSNPVLDHQREGDRWSKNGHYHTQYLIAMVRSMEALIKDLQAFHMELVEKFEIIIPENDGFRLVDFFPGGSKQLIDYFRKHMAPRLAEDFKILQLKGAVDLERLRLLEGLNRQILDFSELLENFSNVTTNVQDERTLEVLSDMASNSDLSSFRVRFSEVPMDRFRSYAAVRFLYNYSHSLLSLYESFSAYYRAGLAGKAKLIKGDVNRAVEILRRGSGLPEPSTDPETDTESTSTDNRLACPQIDPKHKHVRLSRSPVQGDF